MDKIDHFILTLMHLLHRLMVVAGQPSLSDQQQGLVWEWLICWPWTSAPMGDGLMDEDTLNHGSQYKAELREMTIKTSVFDSYGNMILGR